ncbi:MAG: thioredoxin [Thermoplasmata archaeon]
MTDEELEFIRKKKVEKAMKRMNESMPGGPIAVTDADFDETISRYPVVVVDFWAVWCGPCAMMDPVIEELAKTYEGKVVFGKLNVDENPVTATKYGIMAIPTMLVFHNGELVEQLQGAMPASMIQPTIERYVS